MGLRPFYGNMITESANRDGKLHPFGFEMDLAWHFIGEKAWDNLYTYPRAGISVLYNHYDYPEVLGQFTGIYPFFEPFLYAHNKVSASVKIAQGVGYINTFYDEKTNPENIYFSSHLNFIQFFRFALHMQLTERLNGSLGIHYFHVSNSGISEPNLGLEVGAVNLGLDYNMGKTNFRKQVVARKPPYDWKKFDFATTALATLQVNNTVNKHPLIWGLNLSARKYIIGLSAITAGVDLVSDGRVREQLSNDNDPGNDAFINQMNISFLFGHEFMFNRFLVSQQFGYYLVPDAEQKKPWFQRYGISFLIYKNLALGINLKMHSKTGDYLDFRLTHYWPLY